MRPVANTNPKRVIDDQWNERMQLVLRRAAESREARDLMRSTEDARSSERESAALQALIDGHARPRPR